MKLKLAALALLTSLMAGHAAAQETTYTFTGASYSSISNSSTCSVGECTTYVAGPGPVATLTFAAPLAPNLPMGDRSAQVIAYSFTDQVRTTTGPGDIAALDQVTIATDSSGAISDFNIVLQRTPGPPYLVNQPSEPNSRFSYVAFFPTVSAAVANRICPERAGKPETAVTGPGVCLNATQDSINESVAFAFGPTLVTVTSAPLPAVVPTLTEWAMILLAMSLGGVALVYARRRGVV